jgi:hypothetical protein
MHRRALHARAFALVATLAFVSAAAPARAGVVNPDVSLIGQPSIRWTDAAGDPAAKRPVLDVGETELMLDAALNPYARGNVVLSFADGAANVEEAYFSMTRGLPAGLALKGGRYRVGFGKLNPAHPHTYPFAALPGVLAAYLPGGDSYGDQGLQLSEQFALPGDVALTASADWLQGDAFRIARPASAFANDPLTVAGPAGDGDRALEPRPAGLGRLAAFVPIQDRSGLELGASVLQGTNDVAAAARTTLLGADAKLKLWAGASAYWLVQAEWLALRRDDASWDGKGYVLGRANASGGYAFADYSFQSRYDVGVMAERYEDPAGAGRHTSAVGAFAGLALMEETTSFRLDWRHTSTPGTAASAFGATPEPARDTNTITLRVLWSMGPHKAHQF